MLQAVIAITASVGPYRAGERYSIPEDVAGSIVGAGAGEPVEVPIQRKSDGSVSTKDECAECLVRLQVLVPVPPEPAPVVVEAVAPLPTPVVVADADAVAPTPAKEG